MAKKYKTGLVLSGGGTRGFAHLGIIAALQEKGIEPDIISGTSAGAIVGAFIAAGHQPNEVLETFKKGGFFKFTKINLPVDGLLKLDGLKELMEKEIGKKNIEDLDIPLSVTVSNLNKGVVEYINSGPLAKTVLASSSIPVLFAPVKMGNSLYIDGGLMDNVPVKPIKNICEKLVISNISPVNPKANIKNLVQITARTFYMSVNAKLKQLKNYPGLYIAPDGIDNYDILSRSHADELFELGYNSLLNALEKSGF
ncbi:MAG: patatin [Draconibacterium sp.]|nr:MAG: patatin [Draconibacterium sp.]PIF05565.1 MAG: patatin [Draconibacterium sp.]